ncbi:hypothetical protein EVAR_86322_1 [Eumeta japonica]|uniref:Uncharacterized protein n=1 Tax=Eumeta variegata TaxID=151549 RepID=A0A4C1X4U2_EUMVA|nr:hypothetical protein EVAR_86322_1 [Eumeta japonica]
MSDIFAFRLATSWARSDMVGSACDLSTSLCCCKCDSCCGCVVLENGVARSCSDLFTLPSERCPAALVLLIADAVAAAAIAAVVASRTASQNLPCIRSRTVGTATLFFDIDPGPYRNEHRSRARSFVVLPHPFYSWVWVRDGGLIFCLMPGRLLVGDTTPTAQVAMVHI